MLKIVKTSIAVALSSLLVAGNAQADINEALQNICNIVKTDDKGELRKKMKKVQSDYRLKLKDYYSGVTCGGNSLIRTAMLNNALETGELLVKKMPKSDLQSPEQDGKTLESWIAENGLESSPIAAVLKERI
jgi:predicted methyltransferase